MADAGGRRRVLVALAEPHRELLRRMRLVERGQRGVGPQSVFQVAECAGVNPLGAGAQVMFRQESCNATRQRLAVLPPLVADERAHHRGRDGHDHVLRR